MSFEPSEYLSSTLAQLDPHSWENHTSLAKLSRCAPPPVDSAGLIGACKGAYLAGQAALNWAGNCSPEATAAVQSLESLALWAERHHRIGSREVLFMPQRRLAKHSAWATFWLLGSDECDPVVLVSAGLFLLNAWIGGKTLPAGHFQNLRKAARQAPLLPLDQLRAAFGEAPRSDAPDWWLAFFKKWPQLQASLGLEHQPGGCPPSADQFARSRWLGSRDFPSTGLMDLCLTHRQLSTRQFEAANDQIRTWVSQEHPLGILACVSAISGLTIEQARLIPLYQQPPAGCHVWINLKQGMLWANLSVLLRQAGSAPPEAPCLAASPEYPTPLPSEVAQQLRNLAVNVSQAHILAELLPDFQPPRSEQAMVNCRDGIVPSWVRWQSTLGVALRWAGVEGHLAALVVKNFGLSIKSKAYYSRVSAEEIWEASSQLFALTGWGKAHTLAPSCSPSSAAVGCSIVPTPKAVRDVRRFLSTLRTAEDLKLPRWAQKINTAARTLAFDCSVLLALRETSQITVAAEFDEGEDEFVMLHDKQTPSMPIGGPVPVGKTLRHRIAQWRQSCAASAASARGHWGTGSEAYQALRRISQRQPGPMFCLLSTSGQALSVGTASWRSVLPHELWVAPDLGRKISENALRQLGATTHEIDAMLRHDRSPASRSDSSSAFMLIAWLRKMEPLQDAIAAEWLGLDATNFGRA